MVTLMQRHAFLRAGHCPALGACDARMQQSIVPVVMGFFVASLIMLPAGYGLHTLIQKASRKGVFAETPESQYQTLTNVHHDEEI